MLKKATSGRRTLRCLSRKVMGTVKFHFANGFKNLEKGTTFKPVYLASQYDAHWDSWASEHLVDIWMFG